MTSLPTICLILLFVGASLAQMSFLQATVDFDDAAAVCEEQGLVLAEILSDADFNMASTVCSTGCMAWVNAQREPLSAALNDRCQQCRTNPTPCTDCEMVLDSIVWLRSNVNVRQTPLFTDIVLPQKKKT